MRCLTYFEFSLFLICASDASIHGGSFLAMAGEKTIVIACDSRYSSIDTGSFKIGNLPRSIFRVGSRSIVGCFGLDADSNYLMNWFGSLLPELYTNKMCAYGVAQSLSDKLYSSRLICSPIVVGLSEDDEPYICTMDGLGAKSESKDFAVLGTSSPGLFAICESLYVPGSHPVELVKIAEKCLKRALERDVVSGGDVKIFTITPLGIYSKSFSTNDT